VTVEPPPPSRTTVATGAWPGPGPRPRTAAKVVAQHGHQRRVRWRKPSPRPCRLRPGAVDPAPGEHPGGVRSTTLSQRHPEGSGARQSPRLGQRRCWRLARPAVARSLGGSLQAIGAVGRRITCGSPRRFRRGATLPRGPPLDGGGDTSISSEHVRRAARRDVWFACCGGGAACTVHESVLV